MLSDYVETLRMRNNKATKIVTHRMLPFEVIIKYLLLFLFILLYLLHIFMTYRWSV